LEKKLINKKVEKKGPRRERAQKKEDWLGVGTTVVLQPEKDQSSNQIRQKRRQDVNDGRSS